MQHGTQVVAGAVEQVVVTRSDAVGAARLVVRVTGMRGPVLDCTVHDALDLPALVDLLAAFVSERAASLQAPADAPPPPSPVPGPRHGLALVR